MGLKSYTFGSYTRFFIPHMFNILCANGTKQYWELQHKFALEKYHHHGKRSNRCSNMVQNTFNDNIIVMVLCAPYIIYHGAKEMKWALECCERSSNY